MDKLVIFGAALLAVAAVGCKPSAGPSAVTGIVMVNGHRFVDLGLPSGLLWADANIGASQTTDDGDLFSWGEIKTKPDHSWTAYTLHDADTDGVTKYNGKDRLLTLSAADDAATAAWDAPCRIPTHGEFAELRDSANCKWTWSECVTAGGAKVKGYEVVSRHNGNRIFLPASGYADANEWYNRGTTGDYWSSTLNPVDDDFNWAYSFSFSADYCSWCNNCRSDALSIRPVAAR